MKLIPGLLDRTNINNINNNYKQPYKQRNKQPLIDCASDEAQRLNEVSLNKGLKASVEKESVPFVRGMSSGAILPGHILSLKIDLFDNATDDEMLMDRRKFKIAVNIITQKQKKLKYMSSLNSPIRHYKRGIDQTGAHYTMAKSIYDQISIGPEYSTISKCYESQGSKRSTIDDLSVIFAQYPDCYRAWIVFGTTSIEVEFDQSRPTSRQRSVGLIGTWQCTNTAMKKTRKNIMDEILDD